MYTRVPATVIRVFIHIQMCTSNSQQGCIHIQTCTSNSHQGMYTHTNLYQQQSSGYLQVHFDILAQHLPPERKKEREKEIESRWKESEQEKNENGSM